MSTTAVVNIETGTNPSTVGSVLRLRADAVGWMAQSYNINAQYSWSGKVSGSQRVIEVPTNTPGTFTLNVRITPFNGTSIFTDYSYTVSGTAPAPPPAPPPPAGGGSLPPCAVGVAPTWQNSTMSWSCAPPQPAKIPDPTSITISETNKQFPVSGNPHDDVVRSYTVNEPLDSGTVIGWYANDVRLSQSNGSMPEFNYFQDVAINGARIYAVLNPDSGTYIEGGTDGNQHTNTRSNTIIYNPSGAGGAGDGGGTGSGDIDGDGIPDDDDEDIDGDGIHNDDDPTPSGNTNNDIASYDTLYTRASQAQYLGDVFHADPTHTNPPDDKKGKEEFSIPTPLLIIAGLGGAFFLYSNRRR